MSEEFHFELLATQTQGLLEGQIVSRGDIGFDLLHGLVVKRMHHDAREVPKQFDDYRSAEVHTYGFEEAVLFRDVGIPHRTLFTQVFREHDLRTRARIVFVDGELTTFLQSLGTLEQLVSVGEDRFHTIRQRRRERHTRSLELREYPSVGIFAFGIVFSRLHLTTPRLSWVQDTG